MYIRMNRHAKPPAIQEKKPASAPTPSALKEQQLANTNTLEKETASDIENGQLATDELNSHNDI